jgi:uncharacterized protein YndB with AHSA1/START domain
MVQGERIAISVKAEISAPIEKVWKCWTAPEFIARWNHASDDWHSPHAFNDLKVGGKFNYRMEAKDGSFGFDFWGIYTKIELQQSIEYTLGDDRKVQIEFLTSGNKTTIVETFEAESENSIERQRGGWQAILDNFKTLAEAAN